ncbi:MAG TPA: flagellar motor protein MotB [Candidatus Hydrogenedentes bacterium]|nr:flagellar motor protein MotB [Candidatus Hydrogenedentota bacterium]
MGRYNHKQTPPQPGAPLWIISYADMMTLLLACFVMVLSFSTVNNKTFSEAAVSIRTAFGVLPASGLVPSPVIRSQRRPVNAVEESANRLRSLLEKEGFTRQAKIEYDAVGGLKISLPSAFLFDQGSAALRPESLPIFRNISAVLKELPDTFIEVRGHTDTERLTDTSRFRDNYDLSYFRADAVVRQINAGGVPLEQFEIVACGPNQPLASNASPEGRTSNRRVEIFVRGLVDKSRIEMFREGLAGPGTEAPATPATIPRELNSLR